jgi:hypothetical protein
MAAATTSQTFRMVRRLFVVRRILAHRRGRRDQAVHTAYLITLLRGDAVCGAER